MSDAISASVLRTVLRDVKTQREALRNSASAATAQAASAPGALFSDTHAQLLATLPPTELALLQSASVLVHRHAVKRVIAQPSQRSFFRVDSLSRYRQQHRDSNDNDNDDSHEYGSRYADTSLDTSGNSISQPFDGNMARGPNYYNVLPHYCSCQSFHEHTVVQCPTAMCKHMLAALLADATGQCQHMAVGDLDFAKMLCGQLEPAASPDKIDIASRSNSAY